jgi:hypothetical protein
LGIRYRYRDTPYRIVVTQRPATEGEQVGAVTLTVDGRAHGDDAVPLVDDRREHNVEVKVLGAPPAG